MLSGRDAIYLSVQTSLLAFGGFLVVQGIDTLRKRNNVEIRILHLELNILRLVLPEDDHNVRYCQRRLVIAYCKQGLVTIQDACIGLKNYSTVQYPRRLLTNLRLMLAVNVLHIKCALDVLRDKFETRLKRFNIEMKSLALKFAMDFEQPVRKLQLHSKLALDLLRVKFAARLNLSTLK